MPSTNRKHTPLEAMALAILGMIAFSVFGALVVFPGAAYAGPFQPAVGGTGNAGTFTGVVKANTTSAYTQAANGTDYTLITALTCGAGNHFSAATAAGVFTCSADTGAGGTGLSTSSPIAAGNVLVYSSTGTGSAFGAGTTTLTVSGPFTYPNISVIGSSGAVTYTGLATTSALTQGQLLYNTTAGNGVASVATSSLGVTGPITFSGTIGAQVGGVGGNFGCTTATGAAAGCLAVADFLTFNNKVATGTNFVSGNIPYWGVTGTLLNVATGTVSAGSSAITVTSGRSVIGGALAIDCAVATGSQAGCISAPDWVTHTTNRLSTSSALVQGQLLYGTGGAAGQTVASVATSSATINNGLTGTLTTVGSGQTIGLATISAGVLGNAASSAAVPTSQATSTLYGAGTPGQVLAYSNGGIVWMATSSSASGASYPFTPTNVFGIAGVSATSTAIQDTAGLYASTTVIFANQGLPGLNWNGTMSSLAIGTTTQTFANLTLGTSTGPNLLLTSNSNTNDQWAFRTAGSNFYLASSSPSTFATSTLSTANNIFTILGGSTFGTSGNVGLGTSSPYARLSIQADAGATYLAIGSSTAEAGSWKANAFSYSRLLISAGGSGDGRLGIGTTTPTTAFVSVAASTTAGTTQNGYQGIVAMIAGFENTTLKLFQVIDQWGRRITGGDAPVISSCGTSPSFVGSANDNTMTIQVGSVSATGCTATFAHAWPAAPTCNVTERTGSVANAFSFTISTTAIVVTQTALTSDILDIQCTGTQ